MPNAHAHNGILLAVEGISGAGKTTLCNALKERLSGSNRQVLLLGGFEVHTHSSPVTIFVRELVTSDRFIGFPWMSEVHLLFAELLFDIERLVEPALNTGAVVIFDGYVDALLAYQHARFKESGDKTFAGNEYLEKLMDLTRTFHSLPAPDCTVYLRCEVSETKARLERRDKMAVGPELLELQQEIARRYEMILANREILVIDNNYENDLQLIAKQVIDYMLVRIPSLSEGAP